MRHPKLLTTLRTYDLPTLRSDLVAGLTVAMVALPLSIAIAIASGATPEQGLVTAVIGGLLISALGGSRVQIGGPTGAFIVVVYGVIADHGYDGLLLATFMAGIILVIAGYARAGRLISLVPEAVVSGFTLGIAVIIAVSQIKDFFGLQSQDLPADLVPKLVVLWQSKDTANLPALAIGLLSIGLIVMFRRLAPRLPGLLVAICIASALVAASGWQIETVGSRFGHLPNSLPAPVVPNISWQMIVELFPSALVIAFLAGIESLLSAMVADNMIGGRYRPNAELSAQGFANIGCSLFGGLPATGAIARTATNVQAGGKTPVAGIVHALAILGMLALAADLLEAIALPAMAAVLMVTAWNMSEPDKWRSYAASTREDVLLLVLTFVLTILVDLTLAIGVGVALGLAFRLRDRASISSDWSPPRR